MEIQLGKIFFEKKNLKKNCLKIFRIFYFSKDLDEAEKLSLVETLRHWADSKSFKFYGEFFEGFQRPNLEIKIPLSGIVFFFLFFFKFQVNQKLKSEIPMHFFLLQLRDF